MLTNLLTETNRAEVLAEDFVTHAVYLKRGGTVSVECRISGAVVVDGRRYTFDRVVPIRCDKTPEA